MSHLKKIRLIYLYGCLFCAITNLTKLTGYLTHNLKSMVQNKKIKYISRNKNDSDEQFSLWLLVQIQKL